MKKYSVYLFFAGTLGVLSCFLMSQKPQTPKEKFKAEQLMKYERYLGVTDDSTSYALYLLSKKGEYKTVIDLCKKLIRQWPEQRQYNAFLASSYYNLQQKDSADYYTLHYLKQQATKGNINMNDPLMFSKYPTFFPISTDTVLQKKMLQVYLDDYKRKGYPETHLGTRLIELAYNDQKVRNILSFRLAMCSDSNEVSSVFEKFGEFDRGNDRKFLHLYDTHPEYITVAEVGEEASGFCQGILMDHILDSVVRYTTILPMLKRAMDRKEYPPDSYVNACIYILMRQNKYEKARKAQDSLCNIYHCVNKTVWAE
jgi:hypothetical protein